jgi:hypothetical protein
MLNGASSDYFNVERSIDGANFSTVLTVKRVQGMQGKASYQVYDDILGKCFCALLQSDSLCGRMKMKTTPVLRFRLPILRIQR